MNVTRVLKVGRFTVQLNEDEVLKVSGAAKRRLEHLLNAFPTKSLIVRLDMSPWDGKGTPPIYEVETAPGGLMFNFQTFPWHKLRSLAESAVCLDLAWFPAYEVLAEMTGWRLCRSWNGSGKLYFSGEKEVVPSTVRPRVITDPWCSKASIIPITGGEVIDAATSSNFGELIQRYPQGFVVKPIWGWGSRDIYMYPTAKPFSNWARPKKEIKAVIARARGLRDTWMIQPFFPPERKFIWTEFRIWRVYAIRSTIRSKFELLGGTWNLRPTLKVHGASNTVVGEVRA